MTNVASECALRKKGLELLGAVGVSVGVEYVRKLKVKRFFLIFLKIRPALACYKHCVGEVGSKTTKQRRAGCVVVLRPHATSYCGLQVVAEQQLLLFVMPQTAARTYY